ncbi:hypothetical protein [uncultured Sulfitobacter sp.]|uniref:hypothetical protein n=1 Tax=uncultured Sulfitobacter sp. TaxID=191468 RepID=UPI0025945441|nr:hypothetical protein [uncultured Sulfitobacter sp.]
MSAFLVGHQTINAAATLILMAEGPRSVEEMTKLGKSLWLMNAIAVEDCYASVDASEYLDAINTYTFAHVEGVDFAAILKATNCFLYQCSEGHVPEMSLFKKLDAITERYAAHKATDAYEAAPWGLCG